VCKESIGPFCICVCVCWASAIDKGFVVAFSSAASSCASCCTWKSHHKDKRATIVLLLLFSLFPLSLLSLFFADTFITFSFLLAFNFPHSFSHFYCECCLFQFMYYFIFIFGTSVSNISYMQVKIIMSDVQMKISGLFCCFFFS